ncbi:hypothetical protein, partial [Pseudophaeobacter leonis]|uniref:hypothetical protein n=1 Tax=Pseudophaeobacter leonis TaxID=1144477 RepID=UPI0019D3DCC7
IGGAGYDRFEFNIETDGIEFTSLGTDTIADFSEGDVLDVYGWGLGTLDASYSLQGNDSLILLEAGTAHQSTILLEGYHITQNDWNLYGETLSVNWSDAI